jgi:large subunit ribosomal protein L15
MQLHQLKPIHKSKRKKRVGRGGKRGTYSGRGLKGQKSRAGRKMQPSIRELIKKFPKLRGSRSKRFKKDIAVVNIDFLARKFESAEVINPQSLLKKKIIRRIKGRVPKVKILGSREISKNLTIEGCRASKKAREIIEKAGGVIK